MLNRCIFIILFAFMASCTQQHSPEIISQKTGIHEVPSWAEGIVWYQIFPERFRNGDVDNDPDLQDQAGCWPHELREPWQVHPWSSDWYVMQSYEQEMGEDIWYNITRRRYGGDLQGIIDKLDYLQELGVKAIYLNPVFMAPSHHKYDITSYHHIDPNFGPDPEGDRKIIANEIPDDPSSWMWTSADSLALKLIEKVHQRGMRIIFDGVFNHVGYHHFAIADVRENQEDSRFKGWFTIHSWDDVEAGTEFKYEGWWGIRDMPELREDSNGIVEGPKKYIFDITARWMDPSGNGDISKGVDGWRLDVAYEVGHPFWKDWRNHVRSINSEAYLVAEVIDTPEKMKPYLEGDEFDAVMNYNFEFICSEFFINEGITPSQFDELLKHLRDAFSYHVSLAMQNLLGSHDTDRPSSRIRNKGLASFLEWEEYFGIAKAKNPEYNTSKPSAEDYRILKLMATFQMTYPGSPMIYYGDELGMWGAGDPDCRKPMLWEDIDYVDEKVSHEGGSYAEPEAVKPDPELYEYYKKLIQFREEHPALQLGDYHLLVADDEKNLYAFSRRYKNDFVVAVFNNSDQVQTGIFKCNTKKPVFDALSGKTSLCSNRMYEIELEPKSAAILVKVRNETDF